MQGCRFQLDISQHVPSTSHLNMGCAACKGGRVHPPKNVCSWARGVLAETLDYPSGLPPGFPVPFLTQSEYIAKCDVCLKKGAM